MDKISVLKIVHDTIVDGTGLRTSVYCTGCSHQCHGCHNPESWDINSGEWMDIEDIYKSILSNPITNVTFTGGDPMQQAEAFCELAKLIKQNTNKTIWCYTGYLLEELTGHQLELLNYIDVLVDGKYDETLKIHNLPYRGSTNQRIITNPSNCVKGAFGYGTIAN